MARFAFEQSLAVADLCVGVTSGSDQSNELLEESRSESRVGLLLEVRFELCLNLVTQS